MSLIDKQGLLSDFENFYWNSPFIDQKVIEVINRQEIVNPIKESNWIYNLESYLFCEHCRFHPQFDPSVPVQFLVANYCPNCGCKMKQIIYR